MLVANENLFHIHTRDDVVWQWIESLRQNLLLQVMTKLDRVHTMHKNLYLEGCTTSSVASDNEAFLLNAKRSSSLGLKRLSLLLHLGVAMFVCPCFLLHQ
jgi:hypothetical protein